MGHQICENKAEQKTITEEKKAQGKMKTKVHGRLAFTLGGKEETAEAHSSTSPLGLVAGDGSMWVLTKGGPFGDDGNLVRLFLGGEPIPEPGHGTGYLLPIPYHVAIVPFH